MTDSDATVIVENRGPIVVLRLNRPRRLNALSNALLAELVAALEAGAADPSTRVAVITGDERAFAAGAEISELAAPGGPRLEHFDRLWNIELPLIAAVRGVALGGGLELAMSCDLLVVADDARLGQPEINLGLIPGAGGTQRLTHAVGKATAMEMVLLGRELSGREAFARGLAGACVPPERVLGKALQLAGAIAKQAPHAVRAAKRAVLDAFEMPLRPALLAERAAFRELLQTADGREGIAAFLEKRQPVWSDK